VLFVAKVLTGQMKEVNDVREYEEDLLKERTDTNDQTSNEGYVENCSSLWFRYTACARNKEEVVWSISS